jgi:alpha-ribazole phosphatase
MRHGAPARPGLLLGHGDVPSTAVGCRACFDRAQGLAVDAVICSDLQRASRPAAMIASARGVPLGTDPRWRELNFGAWDGVDPATLDAGTLAAFWDDPQGHPPPGGERWSSLVDRIDAALAAISAPALVVTHGGAIRAALACLLGLDYRQSWGFDVPYAALVSVKIWPGAPGTAQITGLAG